MVAQLSNCRAHVLTYYHIKCSYCLLAAASKLLIWAYYAAAAWAFDGSDDSLPHHLYHRGAADVCISSFVTVHAHLLVTLQCKTLFSASFL